jgi:hypothetical protein
MPFEDVFAFIHRKSTRWRLIVDQLSRSSESIRMGSSLDHLIAKRLSLWLRLRTGHVPAWSAVRASGARFPDQRTWPGRCPPGGQPLLCSWADAARAALPPCAARAAQPPSHSSTQAAPAPSVQARPTGTAEPARHKMGRAWSRVPGRRARPQVLYGGD